jgi:hypothetical protein
MKTKDLETLFNELFPPFTIHFQDQFYTPIEGYKSPEFDQEDIYNSIRYEVADGENNIKLDRAIEQIKNSSNERCIVFYSFGKAKYENYNYNLMYDICINELYQIDLIRNRPPKFIDRYKKPNPNYLKWGFNYFKIAPLKLGYKRNENVFIGNIMGLKPSLLDKPIGKYPDYYNMINNIIHTYKTTTFENDFIKDLIGFFLYIIYETIHPHFDSNGRLGRLFFCPSSYSTYIYKNKSNQMKIFKNISPQIIQQKNTLYINHNLLKYLLLILHNLHKIQLDQVQKV